MRVPGMARRGPVFQSRSGDVSVRVGLLVHADARFALDDPERVDRFTFRRLRPSLRGRISRRFEFFVNPDFGSGTFVLQDAFVDAIVSPALRIRAGKTKTPFGMERLHSASNLLFFNRAFPTSVAPNRAVGVQLLGDIAGGLISYDAGVMSSVPDGGSITADNHDGLDRYGRLVARPFRTAAATSPGRRLGVAFSGSEGRPSRAESLPVFQTRTLQRPFFSYSDAIADGVRIRYSPQAFYFYKAFGGWGEYVHTTTPIRHGQVRKEIGHDAWQVAGSWVLSGEEATDEAGGIDPRRPFRLRGGGLGAWQVAARFHALAVDREARSFGFVRPESSLDARSWTVGLNWILTRHVHATVHVERTVFDGNREGARRPETVLALRTQISY